MVKQGFGMSQSTKASVIHSLSDTLKPKGKFKIEHIRDGKVIDTQEFDNGITNIGKNALLDIFFHATTQITTWYIGLVDNASFSAFAAGDTMGSHAGWIESVAYSDSTRGEWTEGAASSQSTTNSVAVTFNINATATEHGVFITSDSTKSGTSGTLWSTAAFTSNVAVSNGDQLKVTYTVSVS